MQPQTVQQEEDQRSRDFVDDASVVDQQDQRILQFHESTYILCCRQFDRSDDHAVKNADEQTWCRARQYQSLSVIKKLRKMARQVTHGTGHETQLGAMFGKTLAYLESQWSRLSDCLKKDCLPIDNSNVESVLRPFVIVRKNWFFSQSTQSTETSTNPHGSIKNARASDLSLDTYLTHVFIEIPRIETVTDIVALLPGKFRNGIWSTPTNLQEKGNALQ